MYEDQDDYQGPWTVCLFLVDRAYGGAEEGGWYYDTGEPVLTEDLEVFTNLDEAREYCRSLQDKEAELNQGRYPVSSVLSNGCYMFQVCDGLPEAYPTERPYYE